MIQISIYCDTCKSNVSVVMQARKAQTVTMAIVGLLSDLHDAECKEDTDSGQGEAVSGGEEAGRDESRQESARWSGEGGSTPGAPGERVGRA